MIASFVSDSRLIHFMLNIPGWLYPIHYTHKQTKHSIITHRHGLDDLPFIIWNKLFVESFYATILLGDFHVILLFFSFLLVETKLCNSTSLRNKRLLESLLWCVPEKRIGIFEYIKRSHINNRYIHYVFTRGKKMSGRLLSIFYWKEKKNRWIVTEDFMASFFCLLFFCVEYWDSAQ